MLTPIAEAIQNYSRLVEEGRVGCEVDLCLRCGKRPEAFRLHDRRKRTFLYLVERLVQKARGLLTRWKCLLCNQTFTIYPAFALPFKRYVAETVCERAQRYVEEDQLSYRQAVLQNGMPVFYSGDTGDQAAVDERTLQHSTLYRWLALFAALGRTRRETLRLIRSQSPSSGVFRKILPIAPWKYRTPERRRVLQDSRQLLVAEQEYRVLFGVSIFPRLATLCAWG